MHVYRYLAFLWSATDTSSTSVVAGLLDRLNGRSREWTVAVQVPGLVVLHTGMRAKQFAAYKLKGDRGVILGRLFRKQLVQHEVPEDPELKELESGKVVKTGGQHLIDGYWGRYVAFLNDQTICRKSVLRDPSGGLACFTTCWDDVRVVFSDVEDVVSLGFRTFSVNWQYVTAFFLDNHLQIADTGLDGVSQLLPGERLALDSAGERRRFLWEPRVFVESGDEMDFCEATTQVRRATRTSIGAWASTSEVLLHQLSGGLDSSIVLSCLSQAPLRPRIVCENQFVPGVIEGDERPLARKAADRANSELVEIEIRPEATLERLLGAPPSVNPTLNVFSFQHTYVSNLLKRYKADTFTSGHGGDQIFYQFPVSVIAADYYRRKGLDASFLRVALDTARLTRSSVWSTLRSAMVHGLLRRRFNAYGELLDQSTFLAKPAQRSVDDTYHIHPWIQNTSDLPPGKILHIYGVVDLQAFQEPSLVRTLVSSPLMFASQPLVEACLRVPTYILTTGGIDRALERAAFAQDLPKEIVDRQTKGGTTRYFVGLVQTNLSFIRDLVLDGTLASHSLLDQARLRKALAQDSQLQVADMFPLLNCIAVEAWLQRWSPSRQRLAALEGQHSHHLPSPRSAGLVGAL